MSNKHKPAAASLSNPKPHTVSAPGVAGVPKTPEVIDVQATRVPDSLVTTTPTPVRLASSDDIGADLGKRLAEQSALASGWLEAQRAIGGLLVDLEAAMLREARAIDPRIRGVSVEAVGLRLESYGITMDKVTRLAYRVWWEFAGDIVPLMGPAGVSPQSTSLRFITETVKRYVVEQHKAGRTIPGDFAAKAIAAAAAKAKPKAIPAKPKAPRKSAKSAKSATVTA